MNEFEKWLNERIKEIYDRAEKAEEAENEERAEILYEKGDELNIVLTHYQSLTKDKIVLVLDKEEYEKRLVSEADKTLLSYDNRIVKLGKLEDLIEKQL